MAFWHWASPLRNYSCDEMIFVFLLIFYNSIYRLNEDQPALNITLFFTFLSFLAYFSSCSSLKKMLTFPCIFFFGAMKESFFKIDLVLSFLELFFGIILPLFTSLSDQFKFSLSYRGILTFLLPYILYWLPSSESDSPMPWQLFSLSPSL